MGFMQCTNTFLLWIHQYNIFSNSACCPLKVNNGLIYKFDHYEDDFSDLTFEYGCRTGNSMFCFISPKDFTLEAVCMFCKSQDQRILMLSFASKRMVTFPLNVLVGLTRSRPGGDKVKPKGWFKLDCYTMSLSTLKTWIWSFLRWICKSWILASLTIKGCVCVVVVVVGGLQDFIVSPRTLWD